MAEHLENPFAPKAWPFAWCHDYSFSPRPGEAWIYRVFNKFLVIKTDGKEVIVPAARNMRDLIDLEKTQHTRNFIKACLRAGLTVSDTILLINLSYPPPVIKVRCKNLQDVEPEVRPALNTLKWE